MTEWGVSMNTAMVWGADGGIGGALTERLADSGWTVLGLVRDPDSVTSDRASIFAADVGDPDSVRAAVRWAEDQVDKIDLWIYAVGDIASLTVEEIQLAEWKRLITANLGGVYVTAHLSLPVLASDAHLIFVGAVSERLRLPGLSAYAAAKAGLEAFTAVLRKEQRGRKVMIVRPKAVMTPFWDKVPFNIPPGALQPEEVARRVLQAVADGKSGMLDL